MASQNDATALAIVSALRAAGASVRFIAFEFGQAGCPDLLVGFARETFLLEVKTKHGRLSADQTAFHIEWRGRPIAVVRTPEEALRAVGLEPMEVS